MKITPKTASIQTLREIVFFETHLPEDYRLECALELIVRQKLVTIMSEEFGRPDDVASYAHALIGLEDDERFLVLCLDARNRVTHTEVIARGSLTSCAVPVNPIARLALEKCSPKIVVIHNHPSGNLTPSTQDIELSKRIRDALALLEIKLLDSLIVTKDPSAYTSLAHEGLI